MMNAPLEAMEAPGQNARLSERVAGIVRFLNAQGWTPATSSNFSYRNPGDSGFSISVSGLDKSHFSAADFLDVNEAGKPLVNSDNPNNADSRLRPSAETMLHSAVYRLYPKAQTVLHTHSVNGAVISLLHESEGGLSLRGFEVLKAFEGIHSHLETVRLPVFPNDQDMESLSVKVARALSAQADTPIYGFLLAGHGLYAWGESPEQAKRHIEAFEYLFECLLKLKAHGHTDFL